MKEEGRWTMEDGSRKVGRQKRSLTSDLKKEPGANEPNALNHHNDYNDPDEHNYLNEIDEYDEFIRLDRL
jgi:hypothetical protein